MKPQLILLIFQIVFLALMLNAYIMGHDAKGDTYFIILVNCMIGIFILNAIDAKR